MNVGEKRGPNVSIPMDPMGLEKIPFSIHDRYHEWVQKHPNKLQFAFLNRAGEITKQYTYGEFSARVDVIATNLAARPDLNPGDRLLLLYPAGLEMICALFACSKAGFIPVPAPPPSSHGFQASLNRLAHILEDSSAAGILVGKETRLILSENLELLEHDHSPQNIQLIKKLPWIASEDYSQEAIGVPARLPNDIFFLQYTSGSTNQPKGVMVTHESILHNCDLVVNHDAPVAVSWLPQHHDMGLIGYYIYIALSGGTTYGFSPATFMQRPSLWLETISKYRATATSAPNFAFDLCLQEKRIPAKTYEGLDLSSLIYLMAAAEPIKAETYSNFYRKFEPYGLKRETFFVAYGLAEFSLGVSFYGTDYLSLNKRHLLAGTVQEIEKSSQVSDQMQLMSCGRVLGDNTLKIVDPDNHEPLPDGKIGEVWLGGRSKCLGYWNRPEISKEIFNSHIPGTHGPTDGYLRTGDMGFVHKGELYICGRQKDLIIVRGQNYYPQDVEFTVEDCFPQIRKSCVAAFEIYGEREQGVAVVAELSRKTDIPDPRDIIKAVRDHLGLRITRVTFVAPRSVPKTSSGKIRRFKTRELLLNDELNIIENHEYEQAVNGEEPEGLYELQQLKERYNLTGTEDFTLLDAGIDSLDLVVFLHWLKESIASRGAQFLSDKVDAKLLGAITIKEIFAMAEHLHTGDDDVIMEVRKILLSRYEKHLADEQNMMAKDKFLSFEPVLNDNNPPAEIAQDVLLTGGTGFLGPFLLAKLLEHTQAKIHVLVRSNTDTEALNRILVSLENVYDTPTEIDEFKDRIIAIRGDLSLPNLGLEAEKWQQLSQNIDTIYHNGAIVNYLLDYRRMRTANVTGTNEILKFAFAGRSKNFNHISTTFIYGWAVKDYLYETDCNDNMELLDFGYSQSKWVSEQLVHRAREKGLSARVFRPALITPPQNGGGENLDITIRLLAFMIKHRMGLTNKNQVSFLPADITANNIISIGNMPHTQNTNFQVVRDNYENMSDVTKLLAEKLNINFENFDMQDFVPEMIRRCTKEDLLFPLLDFLIGSVDNITAMEFKLYTNTNYREAREANPDSIKEPSLDEVVEGIVQFLQKNRII